MTLIPAPAATNGHDLDSKGLGRLRKVAQAREVWFSESADFTPWLAENLDVLGDVLDVPLTLIATEVPVGEFRLDIHAETPEGRTVIVENQLEKTDHGHLGQLLVYASGLEAAAVVWVAPNFREDHRRTIDWLNERTDDGVDFFGVEIAVVQIGEGPRAPVFDVVARPNGWQKSVKASAGTQSSGSAGITPANAVRQDFFVEVLTQLNEARPSVRIPARGKTSWLAYAAGPFGNWDIAVVQGQEMRVEAYLDSGNGAVNKALFDHMHACADAWAQKVGTELRWERMDERRASRIAAYHPPVDFADDSDRAAALNWAYTTALAMFDAMNTELRHKAAELRKAAQDSADSAAISQ